MRHLIPCVLCMVLLIGCRSNGTPSARSDYETLGKYPRRDSESARRENETALVQIAKGDYANAEITLRQALLQDVMFGPAHNNLGLVYYHQSQLYLAAWEFQYAIKLMPNQPEARNNLGLVFEAGGKLDQAVESYDAALKSEPDNPQFIGNSARARIRRGENGMEVRELLARVVSIYTRPNGSPGRKNGSP